MTIKTTRIVRRQRKTYRKRLMVVTAAERFIATIKLSFIKNNGNIEEGSFTVALHLEPINSRGYFTNFSLE